MGSDVSSEARTRQLRKSITWCLAAGLAVWVLIGSMMLVLGGKNPAYGPGWNQWNLMRWMMAPFDQGHDAPGVFQSPIGGWWLIRWCWAALMAGGGCIYIIGCKTHSSTQYPNRRWPALSAWPVPLVYGLLSLGVLVNDYGRGPEWWSGLFHWPAPETVIPVPLVRAFQGVTIVACFVAPVLAYWLIILLSRLWKRGHILP
jgi:hypothetical protein